VITRRSIRALPQQALFLDNYFVRKEFYFEQRLRKRFAAGRDSLV